MKIFIKTLENSQLEIEVEPNDTVAKLKQKIEERVDNPQSYILIFNGCQLDNEKSLSENQIIDNAILEIDWCTHIISSQGILESITLLSRWYDNPDLRDLFIAGILNTTNTTEEAICLDIYKPKVGGFHNLVLTKNGKQFEADFLNAADKPLSDKIVFYTILAISTTNRHEIKKKFDKVLDGIDDGCDGLPKLILIPVLMDRNHFGLIAITWENKIPQIFFFNPLQVFKGYKKEEEAIFAYLNQRYKNNSGITSNNSTEYQKDSCSCGPYIIEFARSATKNAIKGNSISLSFNEMKDLSNQNIKLEIVKQHGTYVQDRLTNYSFHLLIFIQDALKRISSSKKFPKKAFFPHIGMVPSYCKNVATKYPQLTKVKLTHDKVQKIEIQEKYKGELLTYQGGKCTTLFGQETFELQESTIEKCLQYIIPEKGNQQAAEYTFQFDDKEIQVNKLQYRERFDKINSPIHTEIYTSYPFNIITIIGCISLISSQLAVKFKCTANLLSNSSHKYICGASITIIGVGIIGIFASKMFNVSEKEKSALLR